MPTETKSWLQRPEGKFGTVVTIALLACVGGLVVYTWGTILPWIITMLQNTLTALALAAIIALIGVVIFDPRWRNLLFYAYKSSMRGLTSLFIEIDPIGILRTYVDSLKKRLQEMDESIESLGGQLTKLSTQIEKNEEKRLQSLQMAKKAQTLGDDMRPQFLLSSRQAGRLQKSNMSLQNLHDRMSALMRGLKKMREVSSILVQDIQSEVDVKSAERAALLAGYGAFSKAKKIMEGGGDERELFDMTMEKLADEYGMKMGEIETFMDMSKGIINGVDLENMVYEEDALSQLEAWEKKSQMLLSEPGASPAPNRRIEVPSTPGTRIATPLPSADAFEELFEDHPADKAKKR